MNVIQLAIANIKRSNFQVSTPSSYLLRNKYKASLSIFNVHRQRNIFGINKFSIDPSSK